MQDEYKQTTSSVVMIKPKHFQFNEDTAQSNAFQAKDIQLSAEVQKRALYEFESMVKQLESVGINVLLFEDSDDFISPDAIFPNNWFTTHHNGTVILYPMMAPNRRLERRRDIIDDLKEKHKFYISNIIDLSSYEKESVFLEGTGSLIFDHKSRKVYASQSSRTHHDLLERVADLLGYESFSFNAVDKLGQEIYHTNVLMNIGDDFAVLCEESIQDKLQRKEVINQLQSTHHEVVTITIEQLYKFAGNMLQVENKNKEKILVLSEQALKSLGKKQIGVLEKFSMLLPVPLYTIEKYGGGSARCMMAEIHLSCF